MRGDDVDSGGGLVMRAKLMAPIFIAVMALAAAPLALSQLESLKNAAEKLNEQVFPGDASPLSLSRSEKAVEKSALALAVSHQAQSSSDEFRWSGRIAAGRTVEIRGINGDVSAEPSLGGEVEVVAVKKAERSNVREVEVRVVEHAGGVTICAVYPSPDAGRPNECRPDGGNNSVHDNDVQVNFRVRVPQGVHFQGRTVNGNVETGALGGDVDAKTVNGSIKIAAAGVARAKTVNGSITASLGNANWNGALDFKTVNGEIEVGLPSSASADVRAETLNGAISTDFPLTVQEKFRRKEMHGTIGGGGRQLSLKTVNGSIRLRRAS